jgi:excinuclease UvrABC nuclease subunit
VQQSTLFDPAFAEQIFAAIPAQGAVFALHGDSGSQPYVSKTANLRRRLAKLLGAPEPGSKRLNLRDRVRRIEYLLTGSDFESRFLLYRWLRLEMPDSYAQRLRLRFAPLVKLHAANPYPRVSITTRLGRSGPSLYYGPFRSRAVAEKFANDSLDLFKLRRCTDDLHPDPQFPGCIYSEMKMCLAPCFQGCTDEEYAAETARVREYFDSGGQSLVREIAAARDAASADLNFERAGDLHTQIEKLKPLLSQLPEIVGRVDRLKALILQPSSEGDHITMFLVSGGALIDPVAFPIDRPEHAKSSSMEARLQTAISEVKIAPKNALETMEHLALISRWYYRGTRVGEIFFADAKGELPMRRIVRGIARVVRGERVGGPAPGQSEMPSAMQLESGDTA